MDFFDCLTWFDKKKKNFKSQGYFLNEGGNIVIVVLERIKLQVIMNTPKKLLKKLIESNF